MTPRTLSQAGRRTRAVVVVVSALLLAWSPTASVATPGPADFEPRQALFTFPTVTSAAFGLQTEVATAPDGTTVVAFLSGNSGYVTTRPAGGTRWSKPRQVTASTAWNPELAVGEDGTVAAAFDSASGIQLVVRPHGRGAWTEPEGVSGQYHRVAVGPSGAVTLLVSRYSFADGGYQLVSHRRSPARRARLSEAKPVWTADGHAEYTALAATTDGRLAVAWLHDGPGTADEVRMALGTAGRARWRAREVLATRTPESSGFGGVAAALTDAGDASVLWSRLHGATLNDRLETRTRAATGTVSELEVLRDWGAGRSLQLQLAATGDGTAIAVWEDADQQLRASTAAPGTTSWSSPATLGLAWHQSGFIDNVRLAPGPGRSALLTWGHLEQSTASSEVLVRQYEAGGWEPAYRLAEPADDTAWDSLQPVAAIGSGGRQTVVWYRGDGPVGTSGTRQLVARSTVVPPVSLRGPVRIRGKARVGSAMTCQAPFTDAARITFTWRRGAQVVGRKAVVRPTAKLRGARLTCTASGSNPQGTLTEKSKRSARIG